MSSVIGPFVSSVDRSADSRSPLSSKSISKDSLASLRTGSRDSSTFVLTFRFFFGISDESPSSSRLVFHGLFFLLLSGIQRPHLDWQWIVASLVLGLEIPGFEAKVWTSQTLVWKASHGQSSSLYYVLSVRNYWYKPLENSAWNLQLIFESKISTA